MPLPADVRDPASLKDAARRLEEAWGGADVLVNAAGGNRPDALVHGDTTLFDLDPDAFRDVVDLNLTGTLLPVQAFGKAMAERGSGSIVNISSMAARKPLTRVIGYAAAKAAVDNMTQWLAVHAARAWGEGVRVNAIAPGFFLGEQNRALLTNEDGSPTARGATILEHTPMGRFGAPGDLAGTVVWLASDASRFVTGVIVPVDGGYDAFGGV
jgi:NAD(P)-dependent dehydrogenase (short-subunit alcohol dehydrogenase family)